MTLILLLSASRHDKHDTTHQNEAHDTRSSRRCVYYHASFFTQHCRSDVITTSPFLQRHDRRCSSFEVCNPICCCGIGSCCTFLPALHLSFSNPCSTHHLPTNITTPGLIALCCWLWFFYRESFATTHRFCIRRRTRCLR